MIRPSLFTCACLVFAAAGGGMGAGQQAPGVRLDPEVETLAEYRWSHRPVLVFANAPDDPAYAEQMARLSGAAGAVAERDIVVLTDTDPGAAGALRARLGVEGFAVLLVGKDGGLKLRRDSPLGMDELFATIDAMPMRRREMRED